MNKNLCEALNNAINEYIYYINNANLHEDEVENKKREKIILLKYQSQHLSEEYCNNGERICSHCGKIMNEGYCIEGGTDYYCSDKCLLQHMTHEEYNDLYDDGNGDSYWTEW